ncbi:5149_t:CDS:1, partial [Racocetra persica]
FNNIKTENQVKERKKYEPKEYSVIGEIEDIKEKRTYPDDRKEYKPRDPYFYQVFLKNQNPAQYRVISVWKSSLEGDKE